MANKCHSTSRQSLEEEGSTPSAVITRFECLDRPGGGGLADRMLMQRKTFLRAFSVGGRGQISMGIVGAAAEGRDPPLLLLPRYSRLFKNPTSISCKFYGRHGGSDAANAMLPSSRPSRRIRGQLISLMCHVRRTCLTAPLRQRGSGERIWPRPTASERATLCGSYAR